MNIEQLEADTSEAAKLVEQTAEALTKASEALEKASAKFEEDSSEKNKKAWAKAAEAKTKAHTAASEARAAHTGIAGKLDRANARPTDRTICPPEAEKLPDVKKLRKAGVEMREMIKRCCGRNQTKRDRALAFMASAENTAVLAAWRASV